MKKLFICIIVLALTCLSLPVFASTASKRTISFSSIGDSSIFSMEDAVITNKNGLKHYDFGTITCDHLPTSEEYQHMTWCLYAYLNTFIYYPTYGKDLKEVYFATIQLGNTENSTYYDTRKNLTSGKNDIFAKLVKSSDMDCTQNCKTIFTFSFVLDIQDGGQTNAQKQNNTNEQKNVTTKEENSNEGTFTDVPSSSVYFKDVEMIVSLGLTKGYSDGTFRPTASVTRGEFATIMINVFDIPTINQKTPFADIEKHFAKDAIQTLYAKGLINGTSETQFSPNAPVTYEQMLSILHTYVSEEHNGYFDIESNYKMDMYDKLTQTPSAYCEDKVLIMVSWNFGDLTTSSKLNPKANATRISVFKTLIDINSRTFEETYFV